MNKKVVMAIAVVIFIVSAVLGNTLVKMFKESQVPEPSEETKSLIGTAAPGFKLKALDGVVEDSKQWNGKIRVVNFWATWCKPCKKEIPDFIELQDKYKRQDVQFIGVATEDTVESVKAFINEVGLNYPTLIGEEDAMEVSMQMGNDIRVVPFTVIIDPVGNIAFIKYAAIKKEELEAEIKKLL